MQTEVEVRPHVAALTRDRLSVALCEALSKAGITGITPAAARIERARDSKFGDFASNIALVLAKQHGLEAQDLSEKLVRELQLILPPNIDSASVAGKGFINFKVKPAWLHDVMREVVARGTDSYAKHQFGTGKTVLVEFVSANPTGPLHVGNGWWGSFGDAMARLLAQCGYDVTREYYVNDTGGQIRKLGESLLARKRGLKVEDDGYHGAYVAELAAQYDGPDQVVAAGKWAAEMILEDIKQSLEKLDIHFDNWFSQSSIEESGTVQEMIALLQERGLVYEQDGATFLKSTAFGDDRDRVLAKADGDFTYFAGDLAYHRNKLLVRNFSHALDVFGADHHGHVASLHAGVQALGIEKDRLEVRLGQMISLAEGRMSKRTGNFVTLSSLIDDLGAGAVRFLSLMTTIDRATTLDLQMARSTSMENPVHYVRYAYARIAAIGRQREERGILREDFASAKIALLEHPTEAALLHSLAQLPDVVASACIERSPHLVTQWLRATASLFHSFYHDCKVLSSDVPPELMQARLWLVESVRIGLVVGLNLLGVSAPEKM